MNIRPISDAEFGLFQRLILDIAGISLSAGKKIMVEGRLNCRLVHHQLSTFTAYHQIVTGKQHPGELQVMVDLLTTNETSFFREPAHFEYIRHTVLPSLHTDSLNIWSAACSSGEEVYTLAMLLAEQQRIRNWQILGSDVSVRMLKQATEGRYPESRTMRIPLEYLSRHCVQGGNGHDGQILVGDHLKRHVRFKQINLKAPLFSIGTFQIIFLRNVLIYFDQETRKEIVHRVAAQLESGGYFFTSHTEALHGIAPELEMIKPSIYRKR